jgi:NADH-quinone oxidoreductase subunit M
MHTREIAAYGGIVKNMPFYALVMMTFTMANVGLPGTSGFVGEFLTLMGAFRHNSWVGFLATTGIILSACYALWLYARILFGKLTKAALQGIHDLTLREAAILTPLLAMTIFYGIQPARILETCAASVDLILKNYQTAMGAVETASLLIK